MDLVLEVADHFVFDSVYAKLFPASAATSTSLEASSASATAAEVVAALASRAPKLADAIASLSSSRPDRYGAAATYLLPPTELSVASLLRRDNILRQFLSLFVVTTVFGWVLYLSTACFSYYFIYDHDNFKHPKYLKNQVRMEIERAVTAIPTMTLLTVPWFVAETQGFSNLYWSLDSNGGYTYLLAQLPMFILFTDALVYCAHRFLHWPSVYKHLHKPHHKWIVPTPFASHAFHPLDGYIQSLPYHIFPFVFPLQRLAYLGLFGFVNVWTVLIHDGEYLANDPIVNGSACHTIHHLYFNYNYGQYTTLWDRLGGTHRTPDKELFDPSAKKKSSTYNKQISQMEKIQKEVEGDDDREYVSKTAKTAKA